MMREGEIRRWIVGCGWGGGRGSVDCNRLVV